MSVDINAPEVPAWERSSWLPPLASPRSSIKQGFVIPLAHFRSKVTRIRPSLMLPEELEIDAMPFTSDPCMDWIRSHGRELARHEGRYVLIRAAIGIVGASDDPREMEQLAGAADDVLIHFVRPGFYAPATP